MFEYKKVRVIQHYKRKIFIKSQLAVQYVR